MATIKAGTYRFNDVLNVPSGEIEQYIDFTAIPSVDDPPIVFVCNGVRVDGVDLIYYVVDPFETEYQVYDGEWGSLTQGVPVQTITIPNDAEVSAEFASWFTANTVKQGGNTVTIEYNGSVIASLTEGKATLPCKDKVMHTDIVVNVPELGGEEKEDEVEKFFTENFPSDTWNDGEYTGTIQGIPVTMQYKYRKSQPDPKDIVFVTTIQAEDEDFDTTANLADWYLKSAPLLAGRIKVDTTEQIKALCENPIVPTFYDLSEVYTAGAGVPMIAKLKATQCGVRNYEYRPDAMVETVVNYSVETNAAELMGVALPKLLYAQPLQITWYYETNYAYSGMNPARYMINTETIKENGTYSWAPYQGYFGAARIIVDIPPAPDWDGSHTISGDTISFSIDGVTYEAEDGMTWEQWVASDYNTDGYYVGNSRIVGTSSTSRYVSASGYNVAPTELISNNAAYTMMRIVDSGE